MKGWPNSTFPILSIKSKPFPASVFEPPSQASSSQAAWRIPGYGYDVLYGTVHGLSHTLYTPVVLGLNSHSVLKSLQPREIPSVSSCAWAGELEAPWCCTEPQALIRSPHTTWLHVPCTSLSSASVPLPNLLYRQFQPRSSHQPNERRSEHRYSSLNDTCDQDRDGFHRQGNAEI